MNDPYVQPPAEQPIRSDQPVPQYAPPSTATNGLAIASMVLGILWVWWIGSVLALIFGYVALGQIKRSGHGGKGMAIAGVVLGWVGVGTAVIVLIVAVAGSSGIGTSDYEPYSPPGVSSASLSELHDECAAGDMVSCDELFMQSPSGSAEEDFGDDCGGRGHQVGQWCSEEYGSQ